MSGRVVSVNVAHVIETPPPIGRPDAKPRRTGIDKRPVTGPVRIEPLGLVGDSVLDTRHHGGVRQAVYAYAQEDLEWWEGELGDELAVPLTPGRFGENLTLRGVDVTGAREGDRWQVGEVLLEVTDPRVPCSTFASFVGVPRWVRRFAAAGRLGVYLRVVVPGEVRAGDPVDVVPVSAQ